MISNRSKLLIELTPAEAAEVADVLFARWNSLVGYGVGDSRQHNDHVLRWRKRIASQVIDRLESASEKQGFGEL